jgi:hypothetical protein
MQTNRIHSKKENKFLDRDDKKEKKNIKIIINSSLDGDWNTMATFMNNLFFIFQQTNFHKMLIHYIMCFS